MRFHTRLGRMIATSLCIAGVLICTSMPASATVRRIRVKIEGVRSFADGNEHLFLSANAICSGAGTDAVLRVGGDGLDRIHATALEAFLRQRTVEIQYDDQRTGNFCNLVSIHIL
jgi:hypothetical protein